MSSLQPAQTSFPERIVECCNLVGSAAELARRAGMSQPGLSKYQKGSEPGAFALARIAEAAGVSLEWLATGRGQRDRNPEAQISRQNQANIEIIPGFGERLREVLAIAKSRTGALNIEMPMALKPERLKQLEAGIRPQFEDLVELSKVPLIPLNYLLHGVNLPAERRRGMPNEFVYADLVAKLRAIDERRAVTEWPWPKRPDKVEPCWQSAFFDFVTLIYESLPAKPLLRHTVTGNSMEPDLENGDEVLAIAQSAPSVPGYYVLSPYKDGKPVDGSRFIASLALGEAGYRMSYVKGPVESSAFDPALVKVEGRVVIICRAVGK